MAGGEAVHHSGAGQTYRNRNGGEYLCTGNTFYVDDAQKQRFLSLGEPYCLYGACKGRLAFDRYGVIQYADGTIEWNYSTGGHFPY